MASFLRRPRDRLRDWRRSSLVSPSREAGGLINGKVTFVHRRLWPALVRVAHRFQANQLAQVHQEHTASGHHVSDEFPFPKWVPPEVFVEAQRLGEHQACSALGPWFTLPEKARKPTARKKPRRPV